MGRILMLTAISAGLVVLLTGGPALASATSEITEANARGQAVFVVVTQAGAQGTDRALAIARQAQGMAPDSAVVVLDRGATENQELVQRYRVSGAPVPLILVVASNGVVAGGALLKDATAEVLARTIPTPKKAELILHLSQKLPVVVVVSRNDMVDARSAVFEACTQATQAMQHKLATVVVDLQDEAEKAWLAELKIGTREEAPVTVVFNAKGQKTQVFRGVVTAQQIIQAINKKVECCPGGSC